MRLVGSQRLIWPRDALTSPSWTDEDFFIRDLLFEGDGSGKEKGLWLEKGVNTLVLIFLFLESSTNERSDAERVPLSSQLGVLVLPPFDLSGLGSLGVRLDRVPSPLYSARIWRIPQKRFDRFEEDGRRL